MRASHVGAGEIMKQKFAQRVSLVLNPLFVLAIAIALVSVKASGAGVWTAALVVFVFGALVPLCVVWHMLRRGAIGEVFIPHRAERPRPLFSFAMSAWLGAGVLYVMDAPQALNALMLCVAILSVIALLVTMRWKISLHALGIWAACAAVIALYGNSGWLAVVPAGMASWARYALRVHSLPQILAGSIVGAGTAFFIFANA